MSNHALYVHPLMSRYCSTEMSHIFSDDFRYKTWRKMWYNLAVAQQRLGLPIPQEAIDEMQVHLEDPIDYDAVLSEERIKRHDVMAHLAVWANVCPSAKKILHLGATSCDITDNGDILVVDEALKIILQRLMNVIRQLSSFCREYAALPCLGYTHFQAAQLTTVGKRATLWLQDLLEDYKAILHARSELRFRGLKGTTGTQASFLALFHGDAQKVIELENQFCALSGFQNRVYPVTGQTTPRKADCGILMPLSALGASASKLCGDLRLLAHSKQLEEPFEKEGQVGSSAMAYKRNPMRSERCCALARHLITLIGNSLHTAANQWLERSLDDSANRRISISETFLIADAVLLLLENITKGLVVNQGVIQHLVEQELPFIATENILMAIVEAGGDRQEGHELIRRYSIEAAENVKLGKPNTLISMIKNEPYFAPILEKIDGMLKVNDFIGMAPLQVASFLSEHVEPLSQSHDSLFSVNVSSDLFI